MQKKLLFVVWIDLNLGVMKDGSIPLNEYILVFAIPFVTKYTSLGSKVPEQLYYVRIWTSSNKYLTVFLTHAITI